MGNCKRIQLSSLQAIKRKVSVSNAICQLSLFLSGKKKQGNPNSGLWSTVFLKIQLLPLEKASFLLVKKKVFHRNKQFFNKQKKNTGNANYNLACPTSHAVCYFLNELRYPQFKFRMSDVLANMFCHSLCQKFFFIFCVIEDT